MTQPVPGPAAARALRRIRLLHTVVWAWMAACIVAIPAYASLGDVRVATILIAMVWVEVAILAANHWRCPLTDVAARYTTDRRPNFDIYLPEWLARYNKQVFGTWFALGVLATVARLILR